MVIFFEARISIGRIRFNWAENAYMRGEIQEICDLALQAHLGIESYYDWIKGRKRRKTSK
jgi:hypothetical protein